MQTPTSATPPARQARPGDEFLMRATSSHPPAYAPSYKPSVLRTPRHALISLQQSLSEGAGPLFIADELGPVSLAQPDQRLAPGTHPLRDLRRRLGAASGHADVFRGRPADRDLPDREDDPE